MMAEKTFVEFFSGLVPRSTWDEVELELQLSRVAADAVAAATRSGLSRRELAKRMGVASPSTVQRIVSAEAYNVTVETLFRFARASGHRLRISFEPLEATKAPQFQIVGGGAAAESAAADPGLLAA